MLSDIFDGHMLRQLQGVTLKGMRVTETRISKTDLHLTHGATAMAANPWNGKHQGHGFATNGQSPKASFGLAAAHDLSGVTHGTTPLGGRLAQAEYDLPLHVLGALIRQNRNSHCPLFTIHSSLPIATAVRSAACVMHRCPDPLGIVANAPTGCRRARSGAMDSSADSAGKMRPAAA